MSLRIRSCGATSLRAETVIFSTPPQKASGAEAGLSPFVLGPGSPPDRYYIEDQRHRAQGEGISQSASANVEILQAKQDIVAASCEAITERSAAEKRVVRTVASATVEEGKNIAVPDKMNTIACFEFKQQLPVIKDSDPGMERHTNEFQSLLGCLSIGMKRGATHRRALRLLQGRRPG